MPLTRLTITRTTDQSVNSSTNTAVSFDTTVTNTGPASWWDVGTPTNIVMPWAGLYLVSLTCCWADTSGSGNRALWLNNDTVATNNATRVMSISRAGVSANNEGGIINHVSRMITVSTSMTYTVGCNQSSGAALNLTARNLQPPCQADIIYMGVNQRQAQISLQSINRATLW